MFVVALLGVIGEFHRRAMNVNSPRDMSGPCVQRIKLLLKVDRALDVRHELSECADIYADGLAPRASTSDVPPPTCGSRTRSRGFVNVSIIARTKTRENLAGYL